MGMPAMQIDWTADMVRALPSDGNRYEVVDGELLVSPTPALRHQFAVVQLWLLLQVWLDQHPVGVAGVAPYDFEFSTHRMVEPDVYVVPLGPQPAPRREEYKLPLLLGVEVLSPGTARNDRKIKRPLYQSEAVPECWIVDLDAEVVERWRPDDTRPEILFDRLEWSPSAEYTAFAMDLPAFFQKVQRQVAALGLSRK